MKVRTKPGVIEAVQLIEVRDGQPAFDVETLDSPNAFLLPDWLSEALGREDEDIGAIYYSPETQDVRVVGLLELARPLPVGGWVVRDHKGLLTPMSAEEFAAVYEAE